MNVTQASIVASMLLALTVVVGCDKSVDVDAVSISDAHGKTVALEDDPSSVYLHEDALEMPVEVAFRATGKELTTDRALELTEFEMTPCDSTTCTIAKPGSCTGEVCTVIVRWSEPGFCAFETRVSDDSDHGVHSRTYMYVGLDKITEKKAMDALERSASEEAGARCDGD